MSLTVPVKDLAYDDVKTSKWVVEPGKYKNTGGYFVAGHKRNCYDNRQLTG